VYSSFDRTVLDHLRAALGDESGAFAGRVITIFRRQGHELMDDLERAARDRDHGALVLAAHTLKGSSGSVGGRQLTHLCEQLEHWEVGSAADPAPLVESVRAEITVLDRELADYL
jgi:HPt (histidine-containing phosphotransfer) domain-containing protein